jgi:hypothetical protein
VAQLIGSPHPVGRPCDNEVSAHDRDQGGQDPDHGSVNSETTTLRALRSRRVIWVRSCGAQSSGLGLTVNDSIQSSFDCPSIDSRQM